mmetsp:Transcript_31518/g.73403  ORF Transcript_31518/g.73403 Transcript_31518/m.73403 type:complete len:549 (-) Transcript_31518:97-1743(-)
MVVGTEEGFALGACTLWLLTALADQLRSRSHSAHADDGGLQAAGRAEFRRVAWQYLPVYALGTLGDWMQGGHLYALYQSYSYSISHIGHIFAIGYTSAALLGTYAAAFGDRYGYRLCVIVYGLVYSLECLSMNWDSTAVLLAGRVCGGVAYSLLFVSFESWLVAEGQARQLPGESMGQLFAMATTVNALSAVAGGTLAQLTLELGRESAEEAGANIYVAPFNAAAVPLLGCSLCAALLWRERYSREALGGGRDRSDSERVVRREGGEEAEGERPPRARTGSQGESVTAQLLDSLRRLRRDPTLLHIGVLSSLYEATLYAFVFLWTPALESRASLAAALASADVLDVLGPSEAVTISHGKIFSLLMLCKAVGSRVFACGLGHVSRDAGRGLQRTFALRALKLTFATSAACLALPVLSQRYDTTLFAFCAFELMLGFYWPAVAILRTEFVTEGRSSMISVFRVLLNVLVIGLLELSGFLSECAMFSIACTMLAASWVSVSVLQARVQGEASILAMPAGRPKASRSDDLEHESRPMLTTEGDSDGDADGFV